MAHLQATNELNRLLTLACRVGCPADQMDHFLRAGYVPQPRQLEFHRVARTCDAPDGPDRIGYGGTRGQSKSHAVLAQVAMDDCQRFDGLKWLYLRKLQKAAGEQLEDLVQKILYGLPHEYKASAGIVKFPNGSRIVIGGFKDENDIDRYLGLEYDGVVLEDAPTLTRIKYEQIRGSLRTSKPDWRPRLYATANPGGVGHQWFKQEFYDPWRRGQETGTRFVHTTMGDNVFINPEYESYLRNLTGWLKRAWCDGDFEISAGQFFVTWDEAIHVVKPFDIPTGWRIWCALDYGFVHWNVVYLCAQDGDGNVYVVDEHAERRWLVKQHADGVKKMLARNGRYVHWLAEFVSGPDVFARRGSDEETIASKYEREGIKLTPADTDRVNGAAEVLARLGNPEADIAPSLFVFDRCRRLIECLPQMQHDPHRPEDVLKVDCDQETGEGGDDFYDCLRYSLMAVARPRYGPPGTVKYA